MFCHNFNESVSTVDISSRRNLTLALLFYKCTVNFHKNTVIKMEIDRVCKRSCLKQKTFVLLLFSLMLQVPNRDE